jgi:nicotinamide-nucleotide amidase
MQAIFETKIQKYIESFTQAVILSKNVYVYGLTESKVDDLISDILMYRNPTVGIYANVGQVRLRVTAKERTKEICESMINDVITQIKLRLGKFVYGIDVENMQSVVVDSFKNKNKTLAVAESCTGGLISSKIVGVNGASSIFKLGVVCYSNAAKEKILNIRKSVLQKYGAVSCIVAKQMARSVMKISRADVGISTTGIAGPQGGSKEKPVGLVYVGVATKNYVNAYKLLLSKGEKNERNSIRERAALFAINKALEKVEKF